MAEDDTFVLGEGIEARDRVLKSGAVKRRYVLTIKSEKLVFNLNPKALGKGPAEAIIELLRHRIQSITETAAPATLRARKVAAKALALGKSWATKRYAGGRTGEMAPNDGASLFNDSGRFAKTITATGNAEGWTINAAANRLSPDTLDGRGARGGTGALAAIWERLKVLVPELGNPDLLADALPVVAAIRKAHDEMVTKIDSDSVDLALELVRYAIEAVRGLDEIIAA